MEPILPKGQFVILLHQGKGPDHFDLILEGSELCPTFQFDSIKTNLGKRIKDHRKIYLTFEGLISPEKGSVTISEKGMYGFENQKLKLTSQNHISVFDLQMDGVLNLLEKQPKLKS